MLNRFQGCLPGLACGDALGMPVEFMKLESVIRYFDGPVLHFSTAKYGRGGKPPGYYTDDTCMALCLTESLIEVGFDPKDQFLRYRRWLLKGYLAPDGGPAFGVGKRTLIALTQQSPDALPSVLNEQGEDHGNGALMRCVAIGLFYRDYETIKEKSILAAIITHNSPLAAWSCVVLNTLIAFCLKKEGETKGSFCPSLLSLYPDLPSSVREVLLIDFANLDPVSLKTTGHTLHTLQIALWSFLTSSSYEESVTKAIYLGGDTDTQGAVTGALAGTYYGIEGIPERFLDGLMNRERIETVSMALFHRSSR